MAKLSREDILKLARLARLSLTNDEVDRFQKEITVVLRYVEQLQDLDLDEMPATNQVTGLTNVTREDIVRNYGTTSQELLKNAPALHDGHIKVKRMIA